MKSLGIISAFPLGSFFCWLCGIYIYMDLKPCHQADRETVTLNCRSLRASIRKQVQRVLTGESQLPDLFFVVVVLVGL